MSGEQPAIKLVITDLDDTLWRWPLIYVEAYRRMLSALSADLKITVEQLSTEAREVHRQYHDTEYPLSVLELASIQARYPETTLEQRHELLKPYIDIFDQTYAQHLQPSLFHPVHETLQALRAGGLKIIGYTDANSCAITKRMVDFGLVEFYDKIYCRGDHVLEGDVYHPWRAAKEAVGHHRLTVVEKTMAKPQAQVLARILADVNATLAANDQILPGEVLYIGDSLERDMRMVQNFNDTLPDDMFGVIAVHAQYGRQDDDIYRQHLHNITRAELMPFMAAISYWSVEQQANEDRSNREHHAIQRHYTLLSNFGELLSIPPIAATLKPVEAMNIADAALAVGSDLGIYHAKPASPLHGSLTLDSAQSTHTSTSKPALK
jgi:phosphoglycolate phosphatase-like HAD superfamily hydrolase